MAKLDRNRGMLFVSWTGQPIAEAAEASAGSVTAAKFGKAVGGVSGEYTFVYATKGTAWKLNGTTVDLETYGLTAPSSPTDGQKMVITYTAASSGWEAVGKDNDDLSKELNPDTETTKNVLGETTFKPSGYEPEVDVDPYYMDPSRPMYAHLLDVAMQEKYGEADLLGYFAEAFFTSADAEKQTMSGYCYVRRAWIVPQSVGGDTAGYAIPYNINPIGAMEKKNIVYDMTTNQATITDIA